MSRPANPELREKILKAATQIVEECGPDCVTMREVAEKVGYSPTTLYLYFKDKNAILRETVLRSFEALADSCNVAMVGPSNLDKFRQRCRAYVVWGLTNPGSYRLMFEGDVGLRFEGEDHARSVRGLTEGAEIARAAIESGELPPLHDAATFGVATWAALHGATSLAISRRLITSMDQDASPAALLDLATRVADRLINALILEAGGNS